MVVKSSPADTYTPLQKVLHHHEDLHHAMGDFRGLVFIMGLQNQHKGPNRRVNHKSQRGVSVLKSASTQTLLCAGGAFG